MSNLLVLNILLAFCVNVVFLQEGFGSGSNGNLRLCVVEGRGSYKRGNKYCPVLDEEKSGVECVLGTDRLDCLRRISKGTVDFSALSPEDLVAAQWATQWGDVDVLVTNELRQKSRPFDRSIVAVVNRRILMDSITSVSAVLRNRTLCLPAVDVDDLRPLSEVLGRYLESLVTERSCDPELSLTENRIKAKAEFFGAACKAGPWVPNKVRDAELKSRYPSLCEACATKRCSTSDPYWGTSGALNCLTETGDVTWAERDDVAVYFKTISSDNFAYLCHDGTWQPIANNTDPCVWLHRPWNVVVAKRKAAAAVSSLMASLMSSMLRFDQHWHGALAALLESSAEVPEPVHPPKPPMDYLASAVGFREAYSQHGCNPPRHISLCTTSNLEQNKCEWLAEAGAVYGVTPPLQCAKRDSDRECMRAVRDGECDVTVADSDWLVEGMRDFSLSPLLHEATPIIEKTNTVFAYVRKDSKINKMADLRGKRAAFPRFDGIAWHSVLRYIKEKEKKPCRDFVNDYFSEICAPGIENYDFTEAVKEKYTKGCNKKDGQVLEGELEALRLLLEGKTDVAFLSMNTYTMYNANQIKPPTAGEDVELIPVCPEENPKYCFIAWSNIGHIYAAKNLTSMKRNEIINVFTKLDQLFGKNHVHKTMFSMYGLYNHEIDVLFHNNTKSLLTDQMYRMRPYVNVPLSFERTLNSTDSCQFSDYAGFGAKTTPAILLILSLVVSLKMIS